MSGGRASASRGGGARARLREPCVVGRDRAALAGRDDLARVEREAAEHARARRTACRGSARRARPAASSTRADLRAAPRARRRPAEEVHRRARPSSAASPPRRRGRVEVHRLRIDVDEHRLRAGERDDVRRRRERVRRDEHLVARARSRARAPRDGAPRCPTRRRRACATSHAPRDCASNSATFGPIVSCPLSSTSRRVELGCSPTSGRASRIGSSCRSPGTTRSSARGPRRARPSAPSRAPRAPSRRSGSAARRRCSGAAGTRSRRGSR